MKHRTLFGFLLCAAIICTALAGVRSVCAAEVTVTWRPDDAETVIHNRADALKAGFAKAVFVDALHLLPGELPEVRANLLRQRLAVDAGDYVLSYSELGSDSREDEAGVIKTLDLNVSVNRTALKEKLKSLGVFYTMQDTQPFELQIVGDVYEAWDALGRLQQFTGVRARTGASPLLQLEKAEDGVWTGRLSIPGDFWVEADKDLEEMWVRLWAHYFSRPGADAGMVSVYMLTVRGWYAPDGAKAFSAVLSGWDKAKETAALRSVDLMPDGIAATWRVTTMDPAAMTVRLDEYLPSRGLSYSFDPLH